MAQGFEHLTVALSTPLAGNKSAIGTGIPVSDDLVLTARHVVVTDRAHDGPVRLRFWHSTDAGFDAGSGDKGNGFHNAVCDAGGDPDAARGVVWSDPEFDLALVRVNKPPNIEHAEFHPDLPDNYMDWDGEAFPFAAREGGLITTRRINGRANTLFPNTPFFQVNTEIPMLLDAPETAKREGWSGASGSGLFVGNRLIGILTDRLPNAGGHHLRAVAIRAALENPDFRNVLGLAEAVDTTREDLAKALTALQPLAKASLARALNLPEASTEAEIAKALAAQPSDKCLEHLKGLAGSSEASTIEDIALRYAACQRTGVNPAALHRAAFSVECDFDLCTAGNNTAAEFLMATAEGRRPELCPVRESDAQDYPKGKYALPELPEAGSDPGQTPYSPDVEMRMGADLLAIEDYFEEKIPAARVPGRRNSVADLELRRKGLLQILQKLRARDPDAPAYYFLQEDPGEEDPAGRDAMQARLQKLRETYPGFAAVFVHRRHYIDDLEPYFDMLPLLQKEDTP